MIYAYGQLQPGDMIVDCAHDGRTNGWLLISVKLDYGQMTKVRQIMWLSLWNVNGPIGVLTQLLGDADELPGNN
jgi:hypothetical protein